MLAIIAQQLAFQAVWFVCALSGAKALSGPAIAASALFLALCGLRSRRWSRDLGLAAFAASLGGGVDAALVGGGWVGYPGAPLRVAASPVWILALWAAFGPTIPVAFAWLRGRPLLSAVLGALGGALATATGVRLGAVSVLGAPEPAWLAVAVSWGLAIPALVAASSWLEQGGRLRVPLAVGRTRPAAEA